MLPSISVVVPVFRSEDSLRELHRRLVDILEPVDPAFEMILVEDCGGDKSWNVIQELAEADPRVRGMQLGRNYGQHNALLCGIRAARGRTIVTLDDDLQNPPEEIPRLLAKLVEGYDVVYGAPEDETHGFLRNQASRITKLARLLLHYSTEIQDREKVLIVGTTASDVAHSPAGTSAPPASRSGHRSARSWS